MNPKDTLKPWPELAGKLGFSLTPCRGKHPCLPKWPKLPRAKADQITKWIAAGYNLGIVTGSASADAEGRPLIVVDIDSESAPEELSALIGDSQTMEVKTGSGKRHLYFRAPAGAEIKNRVGFRPGVDIRGERGCVVAPGSIHPDTGQPYEWSGDPETDQIADMPPALLEALQRPQDAHKPAPATSAPLAAPNAPTALPGDRERQCATKALAEEAARVANAPESTRNHTLNESAFALGQMVGAGWIDHAKVESALLSAARQVGLPEAEALKTVASGLQSGQKEPRAPLADRPLDSMAATHWPTSEGPDVDLSGIMAKILPPEEEPEEADPDDPGRLPQWAYEVPGFLGEYLKYTLESAVYLCPEAALAGGLALMSYLTGRKLRTSLDIRTNLYLLVIADSGSGKNRPREVNMEIADHLQCTTSMADTMASAEGLQDALVATPTMLWQPDEFDAILAAMGRDDGSQGGRYAAISAILRQLYTTANSIYNCRRRAMMRGKPEAPQSINQPHLVVFATTTPEAFFRALSEAQTRDGLLSRFTTLDFPSHARKRQYDPAPKGLPPHLLDSARAWHEWKPAAGNLTNENPVPYIVPESEEARRLFNDYADKADNEHRETKNGSYKAIWARAAELAERLTLIFAASRAMPPDTLPEIDKAAAQWGISLADHVARKMIWLLSSHLADSDFGQKLNKLRGMLREKNELSPREIHKQFRGLDTKGTLSLAQKAVNCGYAELEEFKARNGKETWKLVSQIYAKKAK